jgi:hypothetical protein
MELAAPARGVSPEGAGGVISGRGVGFASLAAGSGRGSGAGVAVGGASLRTGSAVRSIVTGGRCR